MYSFPLKSMQMKCCLLKSNIDTKLLEAVLTGKVTEKKSTFSINKCNKKNYLINNILLLNLKIYFEVYKCTELISNFLFCFVWFSFSLIFLNFLSDPKLIFTLFKIK